MKKIITFVVMACMLTSCTGLKPDEIVKTPYDNTSETGTNDLKGSHPEGQVTGQELTNSQNKESTWGHMRVIKYGVVGSLIIVGTCVIVYFGYIFSCACVYGGFNFFRGFQKVSDGYRCYQKKKVPAP